MKNVGGVSTTFHNAYLSIMLSSLSLSLIHHFYRVCQGVCSPLGVLKITSLSFCMRCSSWLGDSAGWLRWCSLTNSVYSWNVYWHPFSAIIVITSCNMKKQLTLFSISMSNDTNQKGVGDCEILLILLPNLLYSCGISKMYYCNWITITLYMCNVWL